MLQRKLFKQLVCQSNNILVQTLIKITKMMPLGSRLKNFPKVWVLKTGIKIKISKLASKTLIWTSSRRSWSRTWQRGYL